MSKFTPQEAPPTAELKPLGLLTLSRMMEISRAWMPEQIAQELGRNHRPGAELVVEHGRLDDPVGVTNLFNIGYPIFRYTADGEENYSFSTTDRDGFELLGDEGWLQRYSKATGKTFDEEGNGK